VTLARDVMDDLIKNGRVRRAVIGVTIGEVSPEHAKSAGLKEISGAVVGDFSSDDSPAKRAGLEQGDVIVKADGKPVDRVGTLQRIIRSHEPGENVDLEVIRFGDRKNIKVKLSEAPSEAVTAAANRDEEPEERESRPARGASFNAPKLGITVENLTDQMAREAEISQDRRGVRVTEVERWANTTFVQETDVIVSVLFPRPRRDIRSTNDLRDVLSSLKDGDSISLLVYNAQAKTTRVVSLTLGEQ
jgi:serine protease Do